MRADPLERAHTAPARGAAPPRVTFDLAGPGDDEGLRALLRATPLRGRIELAFLREPSYLAAAGLAGARAQTIVARCAGRVVGAGTRAIRPTWVNGKCTAAGYLGDLRLEAAHRGGLVLARGYDFLRELHRDGAAELYSTVIVEDNTAALRTIAANRAGLPRYEDLGRLVTPVLALPLRRGWTRLWNAPRPGPGERLEQGNAELLPQIVEKLCSRRRQLAIVYTVEDFLDGTRFPGFRIEDFFLLWRGHDLAGVMGLWNQSGFRQTVPLAYRGLLGTAERAFRRLGVKLLPPCGQALPLHHAAFFEADDDRALAVLLGAVGARAAAAGARHLAIGLHERDPRLGALSALRHIPFAGRLFAVTFNGPARLDPGIPHVEASLL